MFVSDRLIKDGHCSKRSSPEVYFQTSLYQLSWLGVNSNHYKSKCYFADVFSRDNVTIIKLGQKRKQICVNDRGKKRILNRIQKYSQYFRYGSILYMVLTWRLKETNLKTVASQILPIMLS